VAPLGFAVDTGKPYAAQGNTTYPQSLSSTWGWNCDLSTQSGDRDPTSHFPANNPTTSGYHSTYIQTDYKTCGQQQAIWNLLVGAVNTTLNFEVHLLYSQQFSSLYGCTINGAPAFDSYHNRLSFSDMAWVVRTLNVTSGKITFAGDNNHGCSSISAMMVFNAASGAPTTDCQYLNGTCCPHFLAMSERPCASFPPPCLL